MATKTVTSLAAASVLATTMSAANASDSLAAVGNKQDVFYMVNNGGGGSINVTVKLRTGLTTKLVSGTGVQPLADWVIAVAAGARRLIGPFPDDYIQADNSVTVEHSGTTSVTGDAYRCTPLDR